MGLNGQFNARIQRLEKIVEDMPSGREVPQPSVADYGKVIGVDENGKYSLENVPNELPTTGEIDAGKVVKVNASGTGYELEDFPQELPTPIVSDAGKTVEVNSSGNGYELVNTYKYLSGLFDDMGASSNVTGLTGNVRAVLAGDMLYIFFTASATEYTASSDVASAPMFSLKSAVNSSDNGKNLRAMLDCARLHGVGAASSGAMRAVFDVVKFTDNSNVLDATKTAKLSVVYYSDSTAYSFVFSNSLSNGGAYRYGVIAFFCPHDKIVWPTNS